MYGIMVILECDTFLFISKFSAQPQQSAYIKKADVPAPGPSDHTILLTNYN